MIILGSGPSARNFVIPDGVKVIAVNSAICKRADYWFSLDWSRKNQEILTYRHQYPETRFLVAGDGWQGDLRGVTVYHRISRQGIEPSHNYNPEWWAWRWSAVLGIPERSDQIHSGNSAWGAIQAAYHLGARRVVLVGVDATQDAKPDGSAPNNLSHLPMLIRSAQGMLEIRRLAAGVASPIDVPEIEAGEIAQWLSQ